MEFYDYLEERFDVESTSGDQLKLSGECPFCHESRSDLRLYVNSETGLGQCFHCGRGFNKVSFVMAVENCGPSLAKRILDTGDSYVRNKREKEADPEIQFPHVFPLPDEVCEYLLDRGVTPYMMQAFQLRYSRGRVIIPIFDINRKLVSWQGRDVTGDLSPKYLFPKGFKGAEYLYNVWNVDKDAEYVIVGEGAFDAFGWVRAGFNNVVATFGKKISPQQANILRGFDKLKTVFMAWDSDAFWDKYKFFDAYRHIWNIKMIDLHGVDADELGSALLHKTLLKSAKQNLNWGDRILRGLNQPPM